MLLNENVTDFLFTDIFCFDINNTLFAEKTGVTPIIHQIDQYIWRLMDTYVKTQNPETFVITGFWTLLETYNRRCREIPTMKSVKTGSEEKEGQSETSEKPVEAAPVIEGAPIISAEKPDFSNVQIEPLFSDYVDFETFSKSDFRAVKVLACEAVPKSKKLLKFTLDDGTGTNRTILSGIHAFYEPEQLIGKTLIAITNLPPRAMMGIESCGMLLSAVHHVGEEEKLTLLQVDPHIPAGAKLY